MKAPNLWINFHKLEKISKFLLNSKNLHCGRLSSSVVTEKGGDLSFIEVQVQIFDRNFAVCVDFVQMLKKKLEIENLEILENIFMVQHPNSAFFNCQFDPTTRHPTSTKYHKIYFQIFSNLERLFTIKKLVAESKSCLVRYVLRERKLRDEKMSLRSLVFKYSGSRLM
jgi:hypothetical protein